MVHLTPYELVKKVGKANSTEVAPILVRKGYLQAQSPDTFICPYHSEKSGSFKSNPRYKKFKCFGCGQSVDGLRLYADLLIKETLGDQIFHMSENQKTIEKSLCTWQAAVDLGFELGLIDNSEKEYQEIALQQAKKSKVCARLYFEDSDVEIVTSRGEMRDGYYSTAIAKKEETFVEIANNKINEYSKINIGSRQELHFVYTLFRQAVENIRGFRLFPHHLEHLRQIRRLNDEEIFLNGYFSHPTPDEKNRVMGELLKLIQNNGSGVEILSRIPGFRYNGQKLRYEIGTNYDAFFIPLWDIYGNTHREQLRTELKSKYLWFTVSGAGNCKTPTSTIYPFKRTFNDLISRNLRPSDFAMKLFRDLAQRIGININIEDENEIILVISEGHFKTYELAKSLNIIGISIQGLNTWSSGVAAMIKALIAVMPYNMRIGKVIIAFDSDTKVKSGLFDNGKYISKLLKNEGIETYYLTWDSSHGKGFDDVKFKSTNLEEFSLVLASEYEERYDTIMSLIEMQHQKAARYLTEDLVTPYYLALDKYSLIELRAMLEKTNLVHMIVQKRLGDNFYNPDYRNEVQNTVSQLFGCSIDQLQTFYSQLNSQ